MRFANWCVFLFALPGCERTTVPSPVSSGSSNVNSETGIAIGQDAFGIDFEVAGATIAESNSEIHGNPEISSRTDITLADDLRIELVTMEKVTSSRSD